jgi:hypothetical protein
MSTPEERRIAHNENNKRYKANHPERVKEQRRVWAVTHKEDRRKYREANKEKMNKQSKEWYYAHKEELYGITKDIYNDMLEKQDYRCAICGVSFAVMKPCIDHDHTTGRVRGILCHKCNRGIGFLDDNPGLLRLAAKFVEENT